MKIYFNKAIKVLPDQPFTFSYLFNKPISGAVALNNAGFDSPDTFLQDNQGELSVSIPANLQAELPVEKPEPPTLKVAYVKPRPDINYRVKLVKRVFDVLFSLVVIILGCPLMVALYLITKFSSKGPAIYKQERIGRHGRPFQIYKLRSMHLNAESEGPRLSSTSDPRITRWGRVIRRTRLDELPQFYNVLKGEMSIVGPRPERRHYIDKIIEKNPDYSQLHALKPGLTSSGQVHYGYAENVDQMCDRMVYDLEYMNNMNLNADLKMICKTVKVMVQCKGK